MSEQIDTDILETDTIENSNKNEELLQLFESEVAILFYTNLLEIETLLPIDESENKNNDDDKNTENENEL